MLHNQFAARELTVALMCEGFFFLLSEMGYLFEYELWGCTEYEVFSTKLKSPSGIALTPEGYILVADYDSGEIVAFDKSGAEVRRIATGRCVQRKIRHGVRVHAYIVITHTKYVYDNIFTFIYIHMCRERSVTGSA